MSEEAMLASPLCRGTHYRLVKREHYDAKLATSMMRGLVQFLGLLNTANTRLSPPTLIDVAWHEAIIDTVNYRGFCNEFFGRFLDHYPPLGDTHAGERPDLTPGTVELARQTYGDQLEALVWRRSKRVQVVGTAQ